MSNSQESNVKTNARNFIENLIPVQTLPSRTRPC